MNLHTRETANLTVDRPVRGCKLGVSALVCLLLSSCAIEEVVPVTWSFSFQCARDADRAELVGLQVGRGGCPIRKPVVFETVESSWGAPASRPQGLPAGIYAFHGTAWDADGQPIASHCESVEIPAKQVIELGLWGAEGCSIKDTDFGDAGSEDDWGPFVDAAGPEEDAGSPSDAGNECSDDEDRDSDGVGDCTDECPDDAAKFTEGQCGCGVADVDRDGDGTADCVDECPVDANKAVRGICGCNVNNQLGPSETLAVGEFLCAPVDDSVRLLMGDDGRLKLLLNEVEIWASTSAPTTGVITRMQGDGNLVIRPMATTSDPNPSSVWNSRTVYEVEVVNPDGTTETVVRHGKSFLAVHANGTATISHEDKVVWTVP